MPWVDENGDEWYDLFDPDDNELLDAVIDALPGPEPEPTPVDLTK